DGQFTDINEGNKLRRLVVGLGMGQSQVDANVQVYQVVNGTKTQIMDFKTHADSGKMPGALIMGAPGAAVGGTALVGSARGHDRVCRGQCRRRRGQKLQLRDRYHGQEECRPGGGLHVTVFRAARMDTSIGRASTQGDGWTVASFCFLNWKASKLQGWPLSSRT